MPSAQAVRGAAPIADIAMRLNDDPTLFAMPVSSGRSMCELAFPFQLVVDSHVEAS